MLTRAIRRFLICQLGALLLPLGLAAQTAETEGLRSRLEPVRAQARAADPVLVRFTLTNTTSEPLTVLKWHTPLEGIRGDIFEVTKDGREVPYIGPEVKRGAPQAEDYVTIEPGASVSVEVDLAKAYALSSAGRYGVELEAGVLDVVKAREARPERALGRLMLRALTSNRVEVELVESRPAPPVASVRPPKASTAAEAKDATAKQPAFKNCNATQQSQLDEAHTAASQMGAGAILALAFTKAENRPSAPRYKTWFGTYTAARYDKVLDNYSKIHGALINETVTFNCACDPAYASAFAYVFPHLPYEVYLCNAFWNAPLTGTDSRGGTIIHEVSHFTVVADTDDNAYGHTACKNLAISDPARAIQNADSHEYFAENTPAQSMGLHHLLLTLGTILTVLVLAALRRRLV